MMHVIAARWSIRGEGYCRETARAKARETYRYGSHLQFSRKELTEARQFSIFSAPEWTDSRLFRLFNFEESLMRTSFVLRMLVLVCMLVGAGASSAQQSAAQTAVPRLVQFSGVLKDAGARPVAGVSSVTFAIYAEQEGGAALWSETQNVLADTNGHYSIVLGAATSGGFPVELFGTGQSRWLGVSIARQPEMPRILMASVPYALKAGDAETLGGLPAAAYVTTQQLEASNARPATTFINGGGSTVIATPGVATSPASSVSTTGANSDVEQSSVIQANPTGSGTTDYIPLWTSGSNLGNSLLFQTGGKMGIGTTSPAATLDINGGEILRGGFYEYPEDTATATNGGKPSHSFQWLASSYNSTTKAAVDYAFGFRAVQLNNNTSTPGAKLDLFYGTGGPTGTVTDTGLSIDGAGRIAFVPTQIVNVQAVSGLELVAQDELTLGAGNSTPINLNGFAFLTIGGYNTPNSVSFGLGIDSLFNTTGGSDTAVGGDALSNDTTGDFNTAVGAYTLTTDTSGSDNSAFGYEALSNLSSGSSNTSLGYETGSTITTGTNNTLVGALANSSSGALTNATAIGSSAYVAESNALVLGSIKGQNGASASVNVGVGVTAPAYTFEVIDSGAGPGTSAIVGSTPFAGHNGVYGVANVTSGSSNGGYFLSNSPSGAGVVGTNTGGGLAASFQGNVQITGTLTKGGGSFKIDDPIDPANKYLSHSFVESPDMMNIYNGIATLDAHGSAVITMPDWFDALNRDFRYQLTAIGAPAPKLYIAEKMHGNQFRIAGGKKGQEVSWTVTGVRQDAWANAHRIPTEEVKPPSEQGRYLHPELFGEGPDKSVVAAGGSTATTPLNGGH
jgi:hypothetical protein